MKHIDEYYKDWCGEKHTTNSCHPVHDSAECTDFAEYYHKEKLQDEAIMDINKIKKEFQRLGNENTSNGKYRNGYLQALNDAFTIVKSR